MTGQRRHTLHDGNFFGEIDLFYSQPRSASVRAVDYCDIYVLDKITFDRVLNAYPDFADHVHGVARQRWDSERSAPSEMRP